MTDLPPKATGSAPIVRAFNQLRQCVIERGLIRDENFHANYQTNGFYLVPKFKGGKGGTSILEVQAFAIITEKADWLMCIPWLESEPSVRVEGASIDADHYTVSELIRVAKPWVLRKAPFDGQTMNGQTYDYFDDEDELYSRRHVTVGSYHEIQVIVEPYRVNELIYAAKGITNGLHIVDADFPQSPPEWQDLNVNSHAWAETFERVAADESF